MRLFLCALLLVPSIASAQWYDRLTVRESLDKKKVPEPAFVTFILPEKGSDTYSVGIGAQFTAWSTSGIETGPFVEYARNTATDKPQDSRKIGWNLEWSPGDLTLQPSVSVWRLKTNHQRDGVKHTESVQASAYYTRQYRGHGRDRRYWYVPNIETDIGGAIFLYSPYVGLEYDGTIKSASEQPKILRSYARWYGVLTAAGRFRELVEFTLDLTHRRDLNGHAMDKTHVLLQAGTNVYFYRAKDGERAAGVGFAYVNGEDPTKGFQEQSYARVSLVLRWK